MSKYLNCCACHVGLKEARFADRFMEKVAKGRPQSITSIAKCMSLAEVVFIAGPLPLLSKDAFVELACLKKLESD